MVLDDIRTKTGAGIKPPLWSLAYAIADKMRAERARSEARIKALEDALKPFADVAKEWDESVPGCEFFGTYISV